MIKPLACLVAASCLVRPSLAQEVQPGTDARSDAPSADQGLEAPSKVKGSDVTSGGADALGRDKDGMPIDANAGQRSGADAGMVRGNRGSVIQGGPGSPLPPGLFPEGANLPVAADVEPAVEPGRPVARAGQDVDVALSGFVDAGYSLFVYNNKDYFMTFLPRRLELDVDARYGKTARIFLDLGLSTSPEGRIISSVPPLLDRDVLDALVEQAFAEWRGLGFTIRGGKIDRPFMNEPLDVTDRVSLSRSTVSENALPDTVTGLYADYEILPSLAVFALVVNGWDTTVEQLNRSKTFGGGLPHRFGKQGEGSWRYEGNLAFLLGPERPGVNDLKWVVNYSGRVRAADSVDLRLELVYAAEQHQGYSVYPAEYGKDRVRDRKHQARWYGGTLAVGYDVPPDAGPLDGLRADLRFEYMRDPDLVRDLPNLHNLSDMTALVGMAATVRYALARGFEVALEYKIDLETGDVPGVSLSPNHANVFKWYRTHELMFDIIGHF